MSILRITVLLAVVLLVSACDSSSTVPYRASTDNVLQLQSKLGDSGVQINLADFSLEGDKEVDFGCRLLGDLDATAGKTVENYIRDAFKDELFLAQAYADTGAVTINGLINEVDFSSFDSRWDLAVTFSSNLYPDGYVVEITHDFKGAFSAISACRNASNAFGPAVEVLLNKTVAHPLFTKLIGQNR